VPRPSSPCARSSATATSTNTGNPTSPANTSGSTPAQPRATTHSMPDPSLQTSHTQRKYWTVCCVVSVALFRQALLTLSRPGHAATAFPPTVLPTEADIADKPRARTAFRPISTPAGGEPAGQRESQRLASAQSLGLTLEQRCAEPSPVDAMMADSCSVQFHDLDEVNLIAIGRLPRVLPYQRVPVEHVVPVRYHRTSSLGRPWVPRTKNGRSSEWPSNTPLV
jgi:hypothetical protein